MGFFIELKYGKVWISSRFPWTLTVHPFMAYPEALSSEETAHEVLSSLLTDGFFDGVEIPSISEGVWSRARYLLEPLSLGLCLQSLTLPGEANPSSLNEGERREAVRRIKGEIDAAASRGILRYAISSGPHPGRGRAREARAQLAKSLTELGDHAAKYGGVVYLETFDTEHDKRQLIGRLEVASEVVREVWNYTRNVAIAWNHGHAPLLGEKPVEVMRYRDLVQFVHVGCAMETPEGLRDAHPVYHTPGAVNTERDLADLLGVLFDTGYEGVIAVAVRPQPGQTGDLVVNAAKGALIKAHTLMLKERLLAV